MGTLLIWVIIGGVVWLLYKPVKMVELGSKHLYAEYAITELAREQGLSGRANLPRDHAMVFVFGHPDSYCFWMKDMRFGLDMLWLDERKRVIMVQHNVQPDTYPQTFCPRKPAYYVLEVGAGIARESGVVEGDTVKF